MNGHERGEQPDDERDHSRCRRRPPPLELPRDPVRFSSPNAMAAQRVREERATAVVCSQSSPRAEADGQSGTTALDLVSASQYGQALRAIAEEAEMEGTQTNFVSVEQSLERSLAIGSPAVTASVDDIAADIGPAAGGSDSSRQDDHPDLVPQLPSEKQAASELEPALDLVPHDPDERVPAVQRSNNDGALEPDHQKESPVTSPPTEPDTIEASGLAEGGKAKKLAMASGRRGASPAEESLGERQLSVYFDRQLCAALLDAWSIREPSSIAVQ
eukprot:COSAG02_NODE_5444_length_4320_cov_2.196873_3_plen_273_part_00